MSTDATLVDGEYTDENIRTLKDAAHIRQNPGMYVGNTQSSGLHHLVYEIVYNSVDEALVGYCKHIKVTIHKDESIAVADDGRGIPIGIKEETGKSTLEEVMTVAGSSGKFDNRAYSLSLGLHGMGSKAVNALSEWCEAEVWRDGRVYKMEFEKGYATTPAGAARALQDLGPAPPGQTGTTITFRPDPDPELFGDLKFDYEILADRFREIAYLCKGLSIALVDERSGRSDTFMFEGGIAEYVVWINQNQNETPVHAPIYVKKDVDHESPLRPGAYQKIAVEIALQYTEGEDDRVRCYTNNAYNPAGGTHLSGFRAGLTRAINAYGKKEEHFKPDLEVRGEDFRTGLTAIVSIGHPDPVFESQTKIKLNNPEMEGIVNSVVYEFLTEHLERNPKEGAVICKRIALAAEARLAAKKARDAILNQKKIRGGLPGKLMDCTTRDRDKNELFLVEGDSAGGSAESGRDRMYQAVLPLRGKVLNVEKARFDKLLKNNEIAALIAATGINIQNVEDVSEVRYGKIIILTDADVDGQHIRTLLLTFFFRQMRKLIEEGHVYVARPPLYRVTQKKVPRFVQTREEMVRELTDRGLAETVLLVTKPESPREVKTDDLKKLLPLLAEAEAAVVNLERRGHTLDAFLGRAKDGVLPAYHVRFGGNEYWFTTQGDVETWRTEESRRRGKELVLSDTLAAPKVETGPSPAATAGATGTAPPAAGTAPTAPAATASPVPPATGSPTTAPTPAVEAVERYTLDEWHEVRTLNRILGKLKSAGFLPEDLVPLPRIAGREPPTRFVVVHDDSRKELAHLLLLVSEIRKIGEKGISVTRFKGLGEMDPEELWDTTLNPKNRTLLRVTLTDAQKAEELFRTLMGEEVEGRKNFIMSRTISNLEEIDYGA